MTASLGFGVGDCRAIMRQHVTTGSVQTCVTSPPYFGLRDYGHPEQIGREATPQAFVASMVDVFREVHRCLHDTGTLWLNLGDSYAMTTRGAGGQGKQHTNGGSLLPDRRAKIPEGLKEKDLMGIPWRVALALQADGWYLRQDIIWHKPNPMPESVRDRCTKAHEYLFLLTKSPRYYFDHAAIQEAATGRAPGNTRATKGGRAAAGGDTHHNTASNLHKIGAREVRNKRSVWSIPPQPFREAHFATFPPKLVEPCILAGSRPGDMVLDPFGGAGTTALVAKQHGRRYFMCELNPDYITIAMRRLGLVP